MKLTRKLFWIPALCVLLFAALLTGFYLRPIRSFRALTDFQMRMAGAQEHWITIDGHRWFYRVQGPENAPVVLLVHGLGGSSADWRNLMPYLVHAGYRVYAPDLPGYGYSDQPADFSYSIADETRAVVDFMDALGLKQVNLAGYSMGGWIAQHLAYQHPDRIQRLMLFDAAGIYEIPHWDTRLFTPTSASELDQLDVLLMPHPPQTPAFIVRDILRISQKNAWVIQRAVRSMWANGNYDATDTLLPQLKMPVLIVWGDQDLIMPIHQAETMHQLMPQSQLEVVQGCGHLAPIQCADLIGPKLEDFLRQR